MNHSKDRLAYIDIAKGIAIICIILGHLGYSSINRVVFTFHVPIFYFITGFFIDKRKDIRHFVRDKVRSLLTPYYVTCLIIVLLGTIEGAVSGSAFDGFIGWLYASLYGAGDSYVSPFYIKAIGAIWFLWASFWGQIFLRISLNMKMWWRVAFIIGLFVMGYFSRSLCWFPLSIQAGACAALFMYIGYLVGKSKTTLAALPYEVKVTDSIFAFVVSIMFIKDFQSFWLVHCDVGRGIGDVFGCISASWIVILISLFIDKYTQVLKAFLMYFGRYSIIVLCVHIVELDLFPWEKVTGWMGNYGVPNYLIALGFIAIKLTFDLFITFLLSKNKRVIRLFGFSSNVA